ncbi:uncharacterized protein LACBIDRAFT_334272 [Laccaria bicolor S238N-H82]|uniref:Predicted protein n=1 Tax=Laccaria bicolor (strain S238N-H82 / ATCC MYA-4686) TaxID=486041 RepID=B0DYP5_LACBS|nr:uncharacterized protein LACBIDRAFT_334272 [Laccaria bicolor S238N-H82]EDR00329.1 predicted protein [Laccaria bicolor S238N-H82]|eukprot:XP_001889081.1 predicted protein [Laccaria bicolor S238N-H82]
MFADHEWIALATCGLRDGGRTYMRAQNWKSEGTVTRSSSRPLMTRQEPREMAPHPSKKWEKNSPLMHLDGSLKVRRLKVQGEHAGKMGAGNLQCVPHANLFVHCVIFHSTGCSWKIHHTILKGTNNLVSWHYFGTGSVNNRVLVIFLPMLLAVATVTDLSPMPSLCPSVAVLQSYLPLVNVMVVVVNLIVDVILISRMLPFIFQAFGWFDVNSIFYNPENDAAHYRSRRVQSKHQLSRCPHTPNISTSTSHLFPTYSMSLCLPLIQNQFFAFRGKLCGSGTASPHGADSTFCIPEHYLVAVNLSKPIILWQCGPDFLYSGKHHFILFKHRHSSSSLYASSRSILDCPDAIYCVPQNTLSLRRQVLSHMPDFMAHTFMSYCMNITILNCPDTIYRVPQNALSSRRQFMLSTNLLFA